MICPAPPVPERALPSPSNRRPRDRAILDAHIGGPPSSSRTSLDRWAEPVAPPSSPSRSKPELAVEESWGHHGQESRPYRFSCMIDDSQASLSEQTTNEASLRNTFVLHPPSVAHSAHSPCRRGAGPFRLSYHSCSTKIPRLKPLHLQAGRKQDSLPLSAVEPLLAASWATDLTKRGCRG